MGLKPKGETGYPLWTRLTRLYLLQEVCYTMSAECCMFIRYAVTHLEAHYYLPRTNSSMHRILRSSCNIQPPANDRTLMGSIDVVMKDALELLVKGTS
jgi:hypothetical protein